MRRFKSILLLLGAIGATLFVTQGFAELKNDGVAAKKFELAKGVVMHHKDYYMMLSNNRDKPVTVRMERVVTVS